MQLRRAGQPGATRLWVVLAIAALVAGCNVGVGLSASIPAPWGYVSVGTSTSFPTHPGW